MGEKSATNLIASLERARSTTLPRLLIALGIRHVGETVAELLADHFGDIGPLMEASSSEIEATDGIGPTIAESVARFFADSANQSEIKKLMELGLNWPLPESTASKEEGRLSGLTFVVTGTLSAPRGEFKKKIEDDEFFEWAEVFGRYYGTPKTPVMEAVEDGRDVVFDIDWQGAQALAAAAPDDAVRVFILPPSLALLEDRLRKRGQDTTEIIKDRMARAKDEISHWHEYDYVIVNDDFARALEKLNEILHAERLKRLRHPWLEEFVDAIMEQ